MYNKLDLYMGRTRFVMNVDQRGLDDSRCNDM